MLQNSGTKWPVSGGFCATPTEERRAENRERGTARLKVTTLAGDKNWVARVELALAGEPPARRPRIWGRRPSGVDTSHPEL